MSDMADKIRTMPVIHLEVERMQQHMARMFTEQELELDGMVMEAFEKATTPEKMEALIRAEVAKEVEHITQCAIESYFKFGVGYTAIYSGVLDVLNAATEKLKEATHDAG